jgi:hypothetical protein
MEMAEINDKVVDHAVRIEGLEKRQDNHMKEVHEPLNKTLLALQNRLPLWATFLIASLSSVATWGLTH